MSQSFWLSLQGLVGIKPIPKKPLIQYCNENSSVEARKGWNKKMSVNCDEVKRLYGQNQS
jgi:hypothetical protein